MTRIKIAIAMCAIACAGKSPRPAAHEALPMAPESRGAAAFRAYTAERLHVSPGKIVGGREDKHSHGSAQAYMMYDDHNGRRSARGWATTDGTIITPKQNLGILFVETGVWARPPVITPDQLANTLAEDILWSYSQSDRLEKQPELALAPDGSGSLWIFSKSSSNAVDFDEQFVTDEGLGGGGGYSDCYFEINVVLTSDHKASLTRKPVAPPP